MSFKDRWRAEKARKRARRARRRNPEDTAVGVAWYSRDQWEALTAAVEDRSELDDTYEDWESQAREALAMLRTQGLRPIRVFVDVSELVTWCREQGRPVNAEARSAFVSHLLRSRDRDGGDATPESERPE